MKSLHIDSSDEIGTRTEDGKRIRWRDKAGVLHAVEGAQLITIDRDTVCLWTRCGSADIPANSAWAENGEPIDCPQCGALELSND